MLLLCFLMSPAVIRTVSAAGEEPFVFVEVDWVDLQPANSTMVDQVVLFFHDAGFDLYDDGKPASALLQRLITREFSSADELAALVPGTVVRVMDTAHEPAPGGPFDAGPNTRILAELDSSRHRYATAFIALRPSNDAFIGNENPYRLELFDLAGKAQLPLTIDFFGSEVLDAGICKNSESSLYFLDTADVREQSCQAENGVVRVHPGYNGSVRNPSATPKRILGATSVDMGGETGRHRYDQMAADFTRPGAKIGRLVFTQYRWEGSQSGSWYSPSRAGEGFNIEVYRRPGSDADEMLVNWYTYDRTGRQLWLTGAGHPKGNIRMYWTHGGRMAAETNPQNVVSEYWGTIRFSLSGDWESCFPQGAVIYAPADTTTPSGRYEIVRLTPRGNTSQRLCEQLFPGVER